MSARSRGSQALTLIELLVTIAIIAVLAGLAVPIFNRMQEKSRVTMCLSHLRQIGTGLSAYLGEHEQTMPELALGRDFSSQEIPVIDTALARYVSDPRIFACPSDTEKQFAQRSGTSYFWNSALNSQRVANLHLLNLTVEHSKIPVIGDKEGFHIYQEPKVNVLYADGHASKELTFRTER